MKPVTRRTVMAGAAAAVAVVPVVGLGKGVEGPSELAGKIRHLMAQEKAPFGRDLPDAEVDRLYAELVEPLYETFPGVPARSAEDAHAAFEYLLDNDLIEHGAGGYEMVTESLVEAIRAYLKG